MEPATFLTSGKNSIVVAAGAADVSDNTIVVDIPARIIKTVE